jgi:hypothetical protein
MASLGNCVNRYAEFFGDNPNWAFPHHLVENIARVLDVLVHLVSYSLNAGRMA